MYSLGSHLKHKWPQSCFFLQGRLQITNSNTDIAKLKNPKEKNAEQTPKENKNKKWKIKDKKGTVAKQNNFITLKMDFV